ncbi:SMI1/KNR4 family protein [Paenibacillus filicis]|uniref:SMI1/KNR4 family protein n=1 Tax=Paenibacillus filicis TaxID=669464 RepID=A0ABU9DQF4_9BACL
MDLKQLIDEIKLTYSCNVHPSRGIPRIEENYYLPRDLKEFYSLCGGIQLFQGSDYAVNIVGPEEFVPANPVIVGERCSEDITSDWYIIADNGSGEYLTIDLNGKRIGRCYDSFIDRHGIVGECSIIAFSFMELLGRLFENKGNYWYWLESSFDSLGDAYDDIKKVE